MAQFIGILLFIGLAVFAIKIALIALILAGLIFKTKETVSILVVLIVLALLRNHPTASLITCGVMGLLWLAAKAKTDKRIEEPPDDPA